MASATAAAATAAPSQPPWQVRWKRPQWERVQVGISDPDDHDSSEGDDSFNFRSSPHENTESIYANNDDVDPSWIPISSSSITLTRQEAHAAIVELRRRDKLLIRRRKKTKTKQTGIPVVTTPPDDDDDNVNLTPLIDNAKTIKSSLHHDASEEETTTTTAPTGKSLTAPSTWFQSKRGNATLDKSNNKSTPSRPPRGGGTG